MAKPTLYGSPLSTYVRATRLTLAEKGVDYDHVDVGVLDGECHQAEHLARNPFGKVPAFEHDGVMMYETSAITRYIDRAFDGPSLTPSSAVDEARMNQIIGIHDSQGYGATIGDTVAYFFFPDFVGGQDDARLAQGKETLATVLSEYERLMGDSPYMAGENISLADLYMVPPYFYLSLTPVADELLGPHEKLRGWWDRMSARESVGATEPQLG
jgi:glutathione S-transferase